MKESLPTPWLQLQQMLGYEIVNKRTRRIHLATKLYPRLTFFLLISLCRVRNNHHFTFLGAITAASSYGVGDTDHARRILKFFGISLLFYAFSCIQNLDVQPNLIVFKTVATVQL